MAPHPNSIVSLSPALPAGRPRAGATLADIIDEALQLDLTLRGSGDSDRVLQILHKNLLPGGKRTRPVVCFLIGELLGAPRGPLRICARAAEFTHAASLAHDDIIDEAKLRRGRPTLHEVTGINRAILGGDLLLACTIEELMHHGLQNHAHELAKAIRELSLGEWLETEKRYVTDLSWSELQRIHELKTGSLLRWCAEAAPRLLELPESLIAEFGAFGQELGLAFQWVDDVLDYSRESGKPYAQDLREGILNSVTLQILEETPELRIRIADFFESKTDIKPEKVLPERLVEQAQLKLREKATTLLHQSCNRLRTACLESQRLGHAINTSLLDGHALEHLVLGITARVR